MEPGKPAPANRDGCATLPCLASINNSIDSDNASNKARARLVLVCYRTLTALRRAARKKPHSAASSKRIHTQTTAVQSLTATLQRQRLF